MGNILHNKKHDIESVSDHNGIAGATLDNIITCNASGLPKDSGISINAAGKGSVTLEIDGAGSTISTGEKAWDRMPFNAVITGYELTADVAGSIVIDIWKDTYANFPPTLADTITASAKPTLSTAQKSTDTTLTGWTTSISAGDYLKFNVDSASTVTKAKLVLFLDKTGA